MAQFTVTQEASLQQSDLWQGEVEYNGQKSQYRYYDGYDGQEVYVLTEQGWEMGKNRFETASVPSVFYARTACRADTRTDGYVPTYAYIHDWTETQTPLCYSYPRFKALASNYSHLIEKFADNKSAPSNFWGND